jgi:hypothetical protein
MVTNQDFRVVCDDCGSLTIKIESPERASRDAIVYCGGCGVSRGTVGALRDLAVRGGAQPVPQLTARAKKPKKPSDILEQFQNLQNLRLKVRQAELRSRTFSDVSRFPNEPSEF